MQVTTFAKQMYPAGTETFLRKYEEAMRHPYEYLLVDLKPNTEAKIGADWKLTCFQAIQCLWGQKMNRVQKLLPPPPPAWVGLNRG